ncbi:DUF4145 domain-containing protein [uncultured Roseobacter sp.]|uniref:DUF4145 domain-containing protein n=1 Tax=uncultured Roseobacter sp. TaxID=114847 RepID=UPI002627E804|nr:DUF4145 domain-containing protein [uncultured Roseobacter sp.]
MSEFVSDCPRCGATNTTLDCQASNWVGQEYSWKNYLEVFVTCRRCHKSSIQLVSQKENTQGSSRLCTETNMLAGYNRTINDIVEFERFLTLRDNHSYESPEYLPKEVAAVLDEANSCLSSQCFNAAAAMYRLALDIATKAVLPSENEPNSKIRRSLGLRMNWLFDNKVLPKDLEDLAECIQKDGNDGAHDGSLTRVDAEDLKDFAFELLRRLYTEPARLAVARKRREQRRQ